ECPAGVNIPKMMLEAKAAYVAENGLGRLTWALARTDMLSFVGSKFAPLANWLMNRRTFRWLVEKGLGISRRRRLPPLAQTSFLQKAQKNGWAKRRLTSLRERELPPVALFVDTFANYHDPDVAEAAFRVLRHLDVE